MAAHPLTRPRIAGWLATAVWLLATDRGMARLGPAQPASAQENVSSRTPRLVWTEAGDSGGGFRVEGLSSGDLANLPDPLEPAVAGALLRVTSRSLENTSPGGLPQLWGRWLVEGSALVFRPRHSPGPGTVLEARFVGSAFDRLSGARGTPDLEAVHRTPLGSSQARVLGVSPGGDEIPANLLRIYVEFSTPMSLRDVDRHARLFDASGAEIPLAFVEVRNGLWDPERRRLTLFVHPGRTKRGVAVGEELGPVLLEGREVTLVVDAAARDAEGRPLAAPFERKWRVGASRRDAIDLASWTLHPPALPSAPLVVETPHALDREIAARALSIEGSDGGLVGRWEIAPGERRLSFQPESSWVSGPYRLRVDPVLEDPSGNRVGRSFDRPIGPETEPARTPPAVFVSFETTF